MSRRRQLNSRFAYGLLTVLFLCGTGLLYFITVSGAQASSRFMQLANNSVSATTSYRFGFDVVTTGPIGSLRVQFCSNSPVIGTACVAPGGFDVSAATLISQIGVGGYTIDSSTTANVLVLTRIPFATGPVQSRYVLDGVVNPNTNGSYYARIETFVSTDASGAHTDYGGVAFSINDGLSITTTVPPYLLFCTGVEITGLDCGTASGDYINFGELSSTSSKTSEGQIVLASNAGNGLGVWVDGNTMTSGTNVVPALSANDVSRPGTSQFGINLVANSTPSVGQNPSGPGTSTPTANYSIPNRYRFVSGEQIIGTNDVTDLRKFTVSYLVNVAKDQSPGIYVTTLSYICLANF